MTGTGVPVLAARLRGLRRAAAGWSASRLASSTPRERARAARTPSCASESRGAATTIDSGWSGRFTSFALSPDGRQLAVGAGSGAGALNVWIKQLDRGPVHPALVRRARTGGRSGRPTDGWSAFVRDTADHQHRDRALRRRQPARHHAWCASTGRCRRWTGPATASGSWSAPTTAARARATWSASAPAATPRRCRWWRARFTELNPADLAGRPVAGLRLERVGQERDLRAALSQHRRRPLAGVHRGRLRAPRWSPDGKELYFIDRGRLMVSCPMTPAPTFAAGHSGPCSTTRALRWTTSTRPMTSHPDGRHSSSPRPAKSPPPRDRRSSSGSDHWFRDLEARLKQ